jgi:hypothetical protein
MAVISVRKKNCGKTEKLVKNGHNASQSGERQPRKHPIRGKAAPKIANPENLPIRRGKVGCVEVVPSHGPIWRKGVYVLIGWKTDINWAVVNHPAG